MCVSFYSDPKYLTPNIRKVRYKAALIDTFARHLLSADIDWSHGRIRVMGKGRCEVHPEGVKIIPKRVTQIIRGQPQQSHCFLAKFRNKLNWPATIAIMAIVATRS